MGKITPDKLRIIIADSSAGLRSGLAKCLMANSSVGSVSEAAGIPEARKKLSGINAAVIGFPVSKQDTLAFIKELSERSIACIVLVSDNSEKAAAAAYSADIMKRPRGNAEYGTFCTLLTAKLILALNIPSAVTAKESLFPAEQCPREKILPVFPSAADIAGLDRRAKDGYVVALGASTGGTDALECVIRTFPETMPPVLVVQHMPPGFTKLYSERLDKCCSVRVREARSGDRLEQGLCLIAAGGLQMELKKDACGYYVMCEDPEKISGHCPSVDVLFSCVAETAGKRSIAALMTGMGSDGAQGMLKMHRCGAYTIAQDKKSCAVYGMPMEACRLGACSEQQPLENIGRILCKRLTDGW